MGLCIAVHQALHNAVGTSADALHQVVTASSALLGETVKAQTHEELRCTAPRRDVHEPTKDVIVIYSYSVQHSYVVRGPQSFTVNAVAKSFEHKAFYFLGT